MLYCKQLEPNAILPTCAHPGEDLAYDIYALESADLLTGQLIKVKTGISARFIDDNIEYSSWLGGTGPKIIKEQNFGLLLRDRSSMAAKGITVSAGVIDSGYSGEILVLLTNHSLLNHKIHAGDKIAQMIPIQVYTGKSSVWVNELPISNRADKGFGSTGQ